MAKDKDVKKGAIPGPKAKKGAEALAPAQAVEQPQQINVEAAIISLSARVTELEGDNLRLAQLCGQVWGEPLASEALKIVSKRQGAK